MKEKFASFSVLLFAGAMLPGFVQAQKTATVTINSNVTYQKITGFGGFVNSGTFAYNHMTTDEIKKLWGKDSDAGYNIMRMYLPIGKDTWSQSLATAQLAKLLGITLFASPWSMPAEWKTNSNIAAKYTDSDGVAQIGYLKEENYEDYANYLNDYVTYLKDNGVELDAISLQNEPDMQATYAGCIWTPAQLASFISKYAHLINCKIIAPESVGLTDDYAGAFLPDSVSSNFDIYAGHQYGTIGTSFKNVQVKGHEVWMTEFLINWNSDESTTRDFKWATDGFSFANKVNTAMLNNVNAWIHYASKRFYGLMGDGTNGTTTSEITKRGYILSHYAKYTIGTTRIQNTWTDDSDILGGSSYLSLTGDSVITMVINSSSNSYSLTVDLPFYSKSGNSITTTESVSMSGSVISLSEETCRPKVTISPLSFTTLIFVKSSERSASQMTGEAVHYNKIEDQTVTNTNFGTNYQLSGKTVTFDHSNFLISSNTSANSGYLSLDDRYNLLVFHIKSITSALNYTSANTTLYYINSAGNVNSYNYGTISFDQSGDYDWALDISRNVLTDGCTGILGISNGNWSSILTITFDDVYFKIGTEKMYKFTGIYSKGDSNFLNCIEDSTYTSLDFTETTSITSEQDWNAAAGNKNCIYYVSSDVTNNNTNVVTGTTCSKLTLSDEGDNFYAPVSFTATAASYTRTFDGYGVLLLPFEANIPTGAKAYTMVPSTTEVVCTQITRIPANTPVLIVGSGSFTFEGSGDVSTLHAVNVNNMNGVYISVEVPATISYYLSTVDGVTGFYPATSSAKPTIIPFSAYLTPSNTSVSYFPLKFDSENFVELIQKDNKVSIDNNSVIYDLYGRRVDQPMKGYIYIKEGKKIVFF